MPAGAAYVGRGTKWGNVHQIYHRSGVVFPWEIEDTDGWLCARLLTATAARAVAVILYRDWLHGGLLPVSVEDVRRELAGRDLACWCPLEDVNGNRVPCHADVLLTLANDPTGDA